MTSKNIVNAALLLSLSNICFAAGPSFNCEKASTKVEKMICSDKNLSESDAMVAEQYKDVTENDTNPAVKRRQLSWLKTVRNACTDVACLEKAYDKRSEELIAEHAQIVRDQKTPD
jgi:uncharacterized protein